MKTLLDNSESPEVLGVARRAEWPNLALKFDLKVGVNSRNEEMVRRNPPRSRSIRHGSR